MSKKEEKKHEEQLAEELEAEAAAAEEIEAEVIDEATEVQVLMQQLEEVAAEADKNLDGWQRSQAEFVNFRKRVERDQSRMYEEAAARIIKRILPVIDDFNRAMQNRPTEGEAGEWADGMELISRKMQSVLESENVTVMQVMGEMFDPNLHEAIAQVESPDHESGQIVEVIQQGYMIGDRVLRAALVRVAS
ncbi:MAG: nucleotide exchange factor GrpE [Anaerolineales bacterium]